MASTTGKFWSACLKLYEYANQDPTVAFVESHHRAFDLG